MEVYEIPRMVKKIPEMNITRGEEIEISPRAFLFGIGTIGASLRDKASKSEWPNWFGEGER